MAASALLRSSGSSVASSSNISKIPPFVGFMARRQYNHFHFHGKGDASQAASEAKCHYCQLEAFSTHKDFAVSIVFTRGETRLIPKDFQFIEDVVLTEGVQLAESQFLSGCKCVDEYDCLVEGCECMGNIAIDGDKINAYHVVGDRKGCLRGHMLNSRLPIYECNDRCGCGEKCANRVVTAGRKVNLQIFPTQDGRGWGMYSFPPFPTLINRWDHVLTSPRSSLNRRYQAWSICRKLRWRAHHFPRSSTTSPRRQ